MPSGGLCLPQGISGVEIDETVSGSHQDREREQGWIVGRGLLRRLVVTPDRVSNGSQRQLVFPFVWRSKHAQPVTAGARSLECRHGAS